MRPRGFSLSLVVLLVLMCFWTSFGATKDQEKYSVNRRDKIFGLHFTDAKCGCAVGDMGLILATEDGGETWTKLKPVTNCSLNDIAFIDRNGWAVGDNGTILRTQNGGQDWEVQASNSDASLFSVFFWDTQSGVVVGERGTVLLTEDGRSSWQAPSLDWTQIIPESLMANGILAINLYDVFFTNGEHGWIVGDSGAVLFTGDGGKSFSVLRIGSYCPLYSVFFHTDEEGWGTGAGGSLLVTCDGGKTWQEQTLPTKANLFKITMSDDMGAIVGDVGTVFQTKDGGKNWNLVKLDLRLPLPWFLDASIVKHNSPGEIVFGGQGIIRKHTEQGQEERP